MISWTPTSVTINDDSYDADFRVESDNTTHMLYVDASLDSVGVGTGNLTTARSMFVAGKGIGIRNSVNGSNDNWTSLHNTETGSASNLIIQPGTGGGFNFTHGSGLWTYPATGYDTVFNQNGNDADFRVESDSDSHMFFVDAGNNCIGIGDTAPFDESWGSTANTRQVSIKGTNYGVLHLKSSSTESRWAIGAGLGKMFGAYDDVNAIHHVHYIENSGTVFNEESHNIDFRVEGDSHANLFTIDAGNDCVNVGSNGGSSANWFYVYEPTSSKTTAAAFNVATTSSFSSSNAMRINTNGFYSANYSHKGIQFKNFDDNAGRSNVEQQFINHANTVVGSVVTTTTGTSFNTTSDYRLKENVVDLTGATERLVQIPVHRFNFIESPDITQDGFLAHEVAAVVPDAVVGEKDAVDNHGSPDYQTMDNSRLVPLLVATIKELEARITALENA
jgi:hypothetical protein